MVKNKEQISHLGVYAVITNAKNQILLIKKSRGPYKGMLDLPGGGPEFHETFEQTLEREVMEETVLNLGLLNPKLFNYNQFPALNI